MGDVLAAADAAALVHRSRGRQGSALTAAAKAAELARAAGGAVSPALQAAPHPLPVTAREREIIALVAEGLTNKQIGEELGASTRTVEGHLHRAAARTGISSRNELALLLRQRADC